MGELSFNTMQTVARTDPAPNLAAPIGLALSGGGDSLALLARLRAAGRPVHAFIVDHGLRADSATEAEAAALLAERLGALATVLRADLAPGTAVQERARRARYALIARAAQAAGMTEIAVAHTADDQAETVAFRLVRGADVFGLAGMAARAPVPVWPEGDGLTLVRPLLGVRRAALRAELLAAGLSWVEDPSNADVRFSRIALRNRLAALDAVERFCAIADAARPLAEGIKASVRSILPSIDWTDGALIPADAWATLGPTARARVVSWLIACLTGADALPRAARAAALIERLATGGGALAGVAIRQGRRGSLFRMAPGRRGAREMEPVPPAAATRRLEALCRPDRPC
jgi:tRNA(Ile)-lysidine synthase